MVAFHLPDLAIKSGTGGWIASKFYKKRGTSAAPAKASGLTDGGTPG
jgi:hypothetical protein